MIRVIDPDCGVVWVRDVPDVQDTLVALGYTRGKLDVGIEYYYKA
jgi:hypothetical protein